MDPCTPTPTPTLAPGTLSARGVDDLLGYVGHALGTLPRQSLVLVTLEHRLLRAVVRVDLPGHADAQGRWARTVAGVCRRDARATAVLALVLDASAEPGAAPAPPWWPALEDALCRADIPVAEAWCSAGERAWPWPPGRGTASQARAVSPESSVLSLHLLAQGSVWGLRDRDVLVPPPRRAAPADARRWPAPDPQDAAGRAAWQDAWRTVLRGGCAQDHELLAGPLVLPAWRDALVVLAACGPDAAAADGAAREPILTASTPEPPDWRSLDRLWEACRGIASTAPARHAAQALAVAAWVSWARGHGSAASAHLEAAEALDPRDRFGSVLRAVTGAGLVAGWATSPETAWRAGPRR
ncbi:DUF4192 domain-containing protein [Micrococcus sp. EYE_162]|uniref:DUF4192 family protein n=1 Tax=unclassified Micrococcus TaxID=2620948 RepID=UPI002004555D|nr:MULTISPECIES: DUF4192 family protein [unclassified Micrococcus]MCK6094950.1 DUF4192 domain-containing protein [Micrococcus sp. EYE_212]MCK6170897.1 DUF4192 domain-containing protein [Micrococcus sp. EYE_162]